MLAKRILFPVHCMLPAGNFRSNCLWLYDFAGRVFCRRKDHVARQRAQLVR